MLKLTTLSITIAVFAGTALAQPAKAPPPPAKAPPTGAPVQTPPPAVAPPTPAKPPEPAPEFLELAKSMNGSWKCTGKVDYRGTQMDAKATITHKLDATLNKFWVQSTFTGTVPKMPPMRFTSYTGYDAGTKKLWRVSVNGIGGHATAVGTLTDKKVSWEADATNPMGSHKMRQTEEIISPKEVKVTGEMSKDGGKTWVFDHDVTCKK